MRIDIKMTVTSGHGRSPYNDVKEAIEALKRAVDCSTPETPALGGALQNLHGEQVGSYIVEFS